MSTGQRQRVKLAQAIAHDPRLVLLDEPTDGLDPVQRDQMLSLIRRCGTEFGIDIVLSSHLLDEVQRVCDAVVIISEGLVVANDTIEVLRGAGGGLALDLDHHDPARVAQALRAHGLEVALDGPQILVTRDDDAVLDIVRDTLVDLGVGIRRLEPRRRSLEDVFLTMDREPAEEATR
jgi:ABC-2 type transport system ATP-binding protein